MKALIKEIIIMILLCVAIILLLVVIFYNYMPMSIVIPNKVEAYVTPTEIKNIVDTDIVDYPKENLTFEITEADLSKYQRTRSYESKDTDPFSRFENELETSIIESLLGTSTSKSSSKSSSNNSTNTNKTNTTTDNTTSNKTSVFDTKIK